MSSELNQMKLDIAKTKLKLEEVEDSNPAGSEQLILMYGNNLAELRNRENRLKESSSGNVIMS